jgi:hypothetical protein
MRSRTRRHPGTRVLLTAFAATLCAAAAAPAAMAADRLPDLGMARISELHIDKSSLAGHRLLRYTAIIVNVGQGPFELNGSRPGTSTPDMAMKQRIFSDTGGFRDVAVPAEASWSGDGHNHWHVHDLELGTLARVDNGNQVGSLAKHGFCFFDTTTYRLTLPGAPQSPVYTNCGTDPSALSVRMGVSVGWGDRYPWDIAFQYIDITNLPDGPYRLTSVVNAQPLGLIQASTANDTTWVDIRLKKTKVTVVAYGPSA